MNSDLKKEIGMTFPSFVWLFLFFFIPTMIVFAFSFKNHDIYGNIAHGWTLDAIKGLARSNYFILYWRTIWLSSLTTLFCLSLALPMGYCIARANNRWKQVFLLLIVIPFWSSFLIRIFAWKFLLHPEGFLKKILVNLYIVEPETSLLYHSGTVLLVMVYSYLPFAVLPIYAAASKFNFQLIEAALDLGSTRLYAFCRIFIPGIRKGLITALLMVFIPAIGAYVIPDVVGGAQSEMIGNKIAQRIFVDRNLPQASALSAILAAVVLIPMAMVMLIQSRAGKMVLEARGKQ